MKKLLLIIALSTLTTAFCHAQTEKGTILLGGYASFSSVEGNSSFVLAPNVGYFVADKIAVGGQASLFTSDGFTEWMIGPYGRLYFGNNASGKPFVGINFGLTGFDGGDTEFGVGVGAGYAIFLNKSIALELGANYNRTGDIDRFGVGAGFQIHFRE